MSYNSDNCYLTDNTLGQLQGLGKEEEKAHSASRMQASLVKWKWNIQEPAGLVLAGFSVLHEQGAAIPMGKLSLQLHHPKAAKCIPQFP